MARDLHLNSIRSEDYMSPMRAAKKIDRMYKRAVQSGVAQQKSLQRVERVVRTESSGGKTGTAEVSDYEKARKMALSTNPQTAKQGRQQLMKLRYQSRQR